MKNAIHIGISGWTYPPWRKTFYPAGLVQHRELEFASRQVNSIEINGSFYSLQSPSSYQKWLAATPEDFVFSVKAHQYITHIKRIRDVEEPIANFLASGILALGTKLGPILWQFPPSLKYDESRFENFLKLLPKDFKEAGRLARRHGARVTGRTFFPPRGAQNLKIRHAVEVRHESFHDAGFISQLNKYNVAIVVADTAGKWPYFEDLTADFRYVRLHGDVQIYSSGYTKKALNGWGTKLKKWQKSHPLFVYFDNDIKVQAPYNAVDLLRIMIKGYKPASPMNSAAVKGLKTPGPRLVKISKVRRKSKG